MYPEEYSYARIGAAVLAQEQGGVGGAGTGAEAWWWWRADVALGQLTGAIK